MKRIWYLVPLILVGGLVVAFWAGLGRDPALLPSALIDRPVPAYDLPAVAGEGPGAASTDLAGRVHLVNFWASWCVPCLAEHPLIERLAADGLPIVGINYKDKPADASAWLAREGNPYALVGADLDGRTGIDFGVYGVPETYVVDAAGRIRHKVVGPLTPAIVEQELKPLVAQLEAGT